MSNVDLLLEKLLDDKAVLQSSRAALKDPHIKKEASKYLVSMLQSSNVFSSSITPTTMEEEEGGSLLEQIANLANDATIIQRNTNSILLKNWDSNLMAHSILTNSLNKLDQISVQTKQLETQTNFDDEYTRETKEIVMLTSLLVKNLDTLIPILELSSLSNSLFKMSKYTECIEISSLVRRLVIRYNEGSLIGLVEKSVTIEIDGMVQSLIKLISTNIKQSTIIKVVSLLKRITRGPLVEVFFRSRYQFILNELDSLSPLLEVQLTERYLKRSIEVVREHCFQTIATSESLFDIASTQVSAFLWSIVGKLNSLVIANLPSIEDVSVVDSLILQLVYCSQSLSRRGGDFSIKLANDLSSIVEPSKFWQIVQRQRNLVSSIKT